jgi:hypothetical protein
MKSFHRGCGRDAVWQAGWIGMLRSSAVPYEKYDEHFACNDHKDDLSAFNEPYAGVLQAEQLYLDDPRPVIRSVPTSG